MTDNEDWTLEELRLIVAMRHVGHKSNDPDYWLLMAASLRDEGYYLMAQAVEADPVAMENLHDGLELVAVNVAWAAQVEIGQPSLTNWHEWSKLYRAAYSHDQIDPTFDLVLTMAALRTDRDVQLTQETDPGYAAARAIRTYGLTDRDLILALIGDNPELLAHLYGYWADIYGQWVGQLKVHQ